MTHMELVKALIEEHGVSSYKDRSGKTCITELNGEFILDLISSGIEFEYETFHYSILVEANECEATKLYKGIVLAFTTGSIIIPWDCPDGKVTITP